MDVDNTRGTVTKDELRGPSIIIYYIIIDTLHFAEGSLLHFSFGNKDSWSQANSRKKWDITFLALHAFTLNNRTVANFLHITMYRLKHSIIHLTCFLLCSLLQSFNWSNVHQKTRMSSVSFWLCSTWNYGTHQRRSVMWKGGKRKWSFCRKFGNPRIIMKYFTLSDLNNQ